MHSDSHCPDLEELQAFLLRKSSQTVSQAIKAHVESCAVCQSILLSLTSRLPISEVRRRPVGVAENSPVPALAGHSGAEEPVDEPVHYTFLQPPVRADEIGRLGTYRVLRLLGEGGMGLVFLAEDIALGRQVALKVLKPEVGGADGWERFLREARIMASCKHDNLVTIFQAAQEGEVVYFAMEFLEGESLEHRLLHPPVPEVADILRIGRETASGLAVLHDKGLIHRDLKPANLWLEAPHGRVKILDLGLARLVEDNMRLTQTGILVGTPAFMSPEQARGRPLDGRSDLFNLGCVLYCLCTGQKPFAGETSMATLTALAADDPAPVHTLNRAIPRALSDLIAELLAKRPENRPQTARIVHERLERIEREVCCPSPSPANDASERTAVTEIREMKAPAAQPLRKRWIIAAVAVVGVFLSAFALRWFLINPDDTTSTASVTAVSQVYLSNLPALHKVNWPIPLPLPPGPDGEIPGKQIRINGTVYPHGIFMHPGPKGFPLPGQPPPVGSIASLSYRLGKHYKQFRTKVSLNDGPEVSESPCTFTVYGDGKRLWQSREVTTQADTQECTVAVRNVDVLKIEVSCPGPPIGAHAVWLDPRVGK